MQRRGGLQRRRAELDEKVDFVKIEDKAISVKLGGKTVPLSFTAKASGGVLAQLGGGFM